MLIVFDMDGTLCDSHVVEERCFASALEETLDLKLETLDWQQYPEASATGIVRALMDNRPDTEELERKVADRYISLLKRECSVHPEEFSPLSGAIEFIDRLKRKSHGIAIATGCFYASAKFKLACCGIDLDSLPHATSNDQARRSDFIALAVERAGYGLGDAIYIGDAPWDVHATNQLGIPFIGVGRRIDRLRELGTVHVFRDYSNSEAIFAAIDAIRSGMNV